MKPGFNPRYVVKEHYVDTFMDYLNDNYRFLSAIENVVDGAYCYGYNTVLEAAEQVLSQEDYWKIVNKIEELENQYELNHK